VVDPLVGVRSVLLRRLYVMFIIELDTRKVFLMGVMANPTSAWVVQQARNLSFELAQRARPVKFLIRDRDAKFTASFDEVFRALGVRIVPTPVKAPRANAFAERFVGTVRRECLDARLRSSTPRTVVHEYVDHYNSRRPHRSLSQLPPQPKVAARPYSPLSIPHD
jgi:putative transposase